VDITFLVVHIFLIFIKFSMVRKYSMVIINMVA